jgi:hypothetical protein
MQPRVLPTEEMQALREYVTAPQTSLNQAESTVRLNITHSNLQAKFMEIRLDLHVRLFCHLWGSASKASLQGARWKWFRNHQRCVLSRVGGPEAAAPTMFARSNVLAHLLFWHVSGRRSALQRPACPARAMKICTR